MNRRLLMSYTLLLCLWKQGFLRCVRACTAHGSRAGLVLVGSLLFAGCSGGSDKDVPAPEAEGAVLVTAEDEPVDGMLSGSSFGGLTKQFLITIPPVHGHLTISNPQSGAFVYLPDLDYHGTDQFTFAVSDGRKSSTPATVSLTVSPVNDAPKVAVIGDIVATPDETERQVLLDITDVDGDVLEVTAISEDEYTLLTHVDHDTGTLTLLPVAPGETTVSVVVSDGEYETAPYRFTARFGGGSSEVTRIANGQADTSALRITNVADVQAFFSLNVNDDLFFTSMDQVLEKVDALPPELPQEGTHRKIWRYLYSNHYHHWSLTSRVWQHDPVLFLNSIGAGMCDDLSSMMYHLTTKAGYESRVWSIGGHVIPEIKVDDRWQVFDANMGVYYKDYDNTIAGMEQLEQNPTLVSAPFEPVRPLDDDNDAYHPIIAEHYGAADDNYLNSMYVQSLLNYNRYFSLPPGATLEFPGTFASAPTAIKDKIFPVHANLKITLPAGFTGRFSAPLVLAEVTGDGDFELNGRSYQIGDEAAARFIGNRIVFAHDIDIKRSDSPITLVYQVHPGRARLQEVNQLVLKGINVGALYSEIVPLAPAQQLPYSLPIEHQPW